jgi:hypothetical protein
MGQGGMTSKVVDFFCFNPLLRSSYRHELSCVNYAAVND